MKDLDIKGTIYDFFGYLLPGILFLFLMVIAYNHSQNKLDFELIMKSIKETSEMLTTTLLIIISYCMGHAISSAGSFLVEKSIVNKSRFFIKKFSSKSILSQGLYNNLKSKYLELYKIDFDDKDFRTVICFVREKNPAIYSTAFVFLSFYGMARTIAFSINIFLLWEVINYFILWNKDILIYIIASLVLTITFYYEYYKFMQYFKSEILNGFLIP